MPQNLYAGLHVKTINKEASQMRKKKILTVIFWVLLLLSDTVSQIIIKTGAADVSTKSWINIWVVVGYSMTFLSFIFWMQILRITRLSIALATASLLYISIPFASHFILNEKIQNSLIVGTLFITVGVFILGFNEGRREEEEKHHDV